MCNDNVPQIKHTTVDEISLKCTYYYRRINKYKLQFHSVKSVKEAFLGFFPLSLTGPATDNILLFLSFHTVQSCSQSLLLLFQLNAHNMLNKYIYLWAGIAQSV